MTKKNHLENTITSPAEPLYAIAKEISDNKQALKEDDFKKYNDKVVTDYGIFVRITTQNGKHTIIAGIHQYGTWIVGEYVNKLLSSKKVEDYSLFSSNCDFIAIIWGEYYAPELKVRNTGIYNDCSWHKVDNSWIRDIKN